jgi:hypothetical protein
MKKKGIYVLIMLVCCFLIFVDTVMAQSGFQTVANGNLGFDGPWSFGKIIAWMFVAFIAFVMLLIFFKVITSLIRGEKLKPVENLSEIAASQTGESSSKEDSHEVCAAIAMAMYEVDENEHDIESTILTIYDVDRTYSPWSSKIYGMREIPVRRY